MLFSDKISVVIFDAFLMLFCYQKWWFFGTFWPNLEVLEGGGLQDPPWGGFGSPFGVPREGLGVDLGCPGEALGAILAALGVTLAALGAILMVSGGIWEPPGAQVSKNT